MSQPEAWTTAVAQESDEGSSTMFIGHDGEDICLPSTCVPEGLKPGDQVRIQVSVLPAVLDPDPARPRVKCLRNYGQCTCDACT